jgi:hypothetical protein
LPVSNLSWNSEAFVLPLYFASFPAASALPFVYLTKPKDDEKEWEEKKDEKGEDEEEALEMSSNYAAFCSIYHTKLFK